MKTLTKVTSLNEANYYLWRKNIKKLSSVYRNWIQYLMKNGFWTPSSMWFY